MTPIVTPTRRAPPAPASSIEAERCSLVTTPSRRPAGTAQDRAQIGTKPASTSPEWISGLRLARRGAQAAVAPPATGSCSRRSGCGHQHAELAYLDALATQEAHPDSPRALGLSIARWWDTELGGSSRGVVASHHHPQGRAVRVTSVPAALGWLSRVRGASPSGANVVGRREPRFGGRHRTNGTSRSRVRCLEGGAPFWASQRGTRHPDIDSRPLGAVFIRIRSQSCIDRQSWARPFLVRPAADRPPPCATKSRARGPRAVLADPNAL